MAIANTTTSTLRREWTEALLRQMPSVSPADLATVSDRDLCLLLELTRPAAAYLRGLLNAVRSRSVGHVD